tara:strand:- start:740 stop:1540 length:801 start_codon:yes stop_codon:yes gene_type:complete
MNPDSDQGKSARFPTNFLSSEPRKPIPIDNNNDTGGGLATDAPPCRLACNSYYTSEAYKNDISFCLTNIGALYVGQNMLRSPPYFPYSFSCKNIRANDTKGIVLRQKENDLSGVNPLISGPSHSENNKNILEYWGLLFDGKLRENTLNSSVLNKIERFYRSNGSYSEGLYFYNFGLNTNPYSNQPNGFQNLIHYKHIDFAYQTIIPPLDTSAQLLPLCDTNGNYLGVNKPQWNIYLYNYDLIIMEEQYNILSIENGLATLTLTNHS